MPVWNSPSVCSKRRTTSRRAADREKPNRADYQARLDKISSIFADMVKHADAVSMTRCPYKNRFDACTAQFGCRYQKREPESEMVACTSDDKLDYRTAWDKNQASKDEMRERLRSGRTSGSKD